MSRKIFSLFVLLSFPFFLIAAFGPDVSELNGKKLKWENSKSDYFVMFKSLVKNDNRTSCTPSAQKKCALGDDLNGNPQADACIDQSVGSTFELLESHIPNDAVVQAAYLIWVSALPADRVPDGKTDNQVTLSFKGNNSTELSTEVSATETEKTINDGQDFNFGIIESIYSLSTSCTTDEECTTDGQLGPGWKCMSGKCSIHTVVYTYRADVTEFFEDISSADLLNKGKALNGKYTVSNMDCTNDPNYLILSGMVGGWALVFVYTSEIVSPKNIYIYDGFDALSFEERFVSVNGFDLPENAEGRLTMISFEGDPGLATSTNIYDQFGPPPPAEGFYISGEQKFPSGDWLPLWNDCNLTKTTDSNNIAFNYTEVYNSISSVYDWNGESPSCAGGSPGYVNPDLLDYAMDVDTFVLSAEDDLYKPHLIAGDTILNLRIGTNQDQIYTNLIVLSIDTKVAEEEIEDSDDRENADDEIEDLDNFISTDDDSSLNDNGISVDDENEINDDLEKNDSDHKDSENTESSMKSNGCSVTVF